MFTVIGVPNAPMVRRFEYVVEKRLP